MAIALGVRVAELGQRVYFTTAIELARRLTKVTCEHRLHREIKNLVRLSVLIIDEVGYLTLDSTQASLVFQVMAERYEKQQAVILTSNKAFAEWAQVFTGDAVMASAALDRLLHRATVLNIRGESYRMRARHCAGERVDMMQTDAEEQPDPPDVPPGWVNSRRSQAGQFSALVDTKLGMGSGIVLNQSDRASQSLLAINIRWSSMETMSKR